MKPETRPISAAEVEVVSAALRRASKINVPATLLESVGGLSVTAKCECGCPSVDFGKDPAKRSGVIADGIGATPEGVEVGVMVWGTPERVTGLEIYELAAPIRELPTAESIKAWEDFKNPADR